MRPRSGQGTIGDGHRHQTRRPVLSHHASDFLRELVPRAKTGADAVIQAGIAQLEQRPRRRGHVDDVTRRHRAIDERPDFAVLIEGLDDAIDRAFCTLAAEQALDTQHVRARNLEREPLTEQLRLCVHTLRVGYVLFGIRPRSRPVEHEVGAVVHQRRANLLRSPPETPDRKRVAGERLVRLILGTVHMVIRGAVDDGVGAIRVHARRHRVDVGDIQIFARVRGDLRCVLIGLDDGAGQLAACAGDEYFHDGHSVSPATAVSKASSGHTSIPSSVLSRLSPR